VTVVVIMGVSGAGKSTVGRAVAQRLGVDFVEGDRLHPADNVARMAAGVPLTDEDRQPWLDAIAGEIEQHRSAGRSVVIACSALRRRYRDRLRQTGPIRFVLLDPTADELDERLDGRTHEFMPPSLLADQLATFERPDGEPDVVTVVPAGVDATVDRVIGALSRP
jgi:gluconokinase